MVYGIELGAALMARVDLLIVEHRQIAEYQHDETGACRFLF